MTEDFTSMSGHAAVLRRQWWIIALVALVGAGLGAFGATLASPTYDAESVVLVPVRDDATGTAVVDTQVQVVTSDEVVDGVVADLGSETDASELVDSMSVEVVPDTTAISITAVRDTPADAALVANAFADSYMQVYEATLLAQQNSTTESLRAQLVTTTDRLVELRQELPRLTGTEQLETEAAISRQQQRQSRLVDLLADARDPTTAAQPASVLQEAVAPPGESSAGLLRAALFGLALGLLLGLAIAYGRQQRDDRIRDEAQVVALVGGTPILGRIPRMTGRRGGGALSDPSSKTAEAYRGLAVNLRLKSEHPRTSRLDSSPRVATAGAGVMALIVSGSPGEGKSSVAGDLARTAAGMGLRVTLVDADLRNPQLANRFGLIQPHPGLTDVLLDGPSTKPTPTEVGVPNLELLPAGAMHADPAALLSRANPTDVWDILRATSDLVVVDTAPVLYAAETLELATLADRIVLVVERGSTTQRDLRTVVERMHLVGVRPTGAVFTKVPATEVVGGYYPLQG